MYWKAKNAALVPVKIMPYFAAVKVITNIMNLSRLDFHTYSASEEYIIVDSVNTMELCVDGIRLGG
jgi:hypothetical protein